MGVYSYSYVYGSKPSRDREIKLEIVVELKSTEVQTLGVR